MNKRIGLHIRLEHSVLDAVEKKNELQLPFFQMFLVRHTTGKLFKVTGQELQTFHEQNNNDPFYVHGSYWINLAHLGEYGTKSFRREMRLSQELGASALIVHPGVAKKVPNRTVGIENVIRTLNKQLTEDSIPIMLENTAHANLMVGSNILDFPYILARLDRPEKISFCIDTAHAHAFGYDIHTEKGQDLFIDFLDNTIGIERISLIHLNDTNQRCGSKIDRHIVPGKGVLGKEMLHRFMMHEKLAHIPVILELPKVSDSVARSVVRQVCSW